MFNFFKRKTTEEKLKILKCSSNFCEICEEMVFTNLKKCNSCGNKRICSYCKIGKTDCLCKECNKEVDDFFNNLEKSIKIQEKHVIQWGDLNDLP